MPKINLKRTVHVGGKVFFKGDAFVTDAEEVMIQAEIERLEEIEAQAAEAAEDAEENIEAPKKSNRKSDK
ncbi:MAG: hypothetical protein ABWZ66_11800 [Pyrinomonadaceae bacterium]